MDVMAAVYLTGARGSVAVRSVCVVFGEDEGGSAAEAIVLKHVNLQAGTMCAERASFSI